MQNTRSASPAIFLQVGVQGRSIVQDRGLPGGLLEGLEGLLCKEGDSLRALCYLRRSNERDHQDPQTAYGLAFAQDSIVPAQKHFPEVLEIGSYPRSCARWRPAGSGPGGRGRTAVFYPGDHLRDRHAGQVLAGYQ